MFQGAPAQTPTGLLESDPSMEFGRSPDTHPDPP
jgi:hypothetical protein